LIEIDPSSDWHPSRNVITGLTDVSGTLFFTLDHPGCGRELWKSDGTVEGTGMVKDIRPAHPLDPDYIGSHPSSFINVNGTLYFTAEHPDYGRELWRSDGTEVGTVLVKDIVPGPTRSYVSNMTNVDGTLFFVAEDCLWKTDGTEHGTVIVHESDTGSVYVVGVRGVTLIFRGANRDVWATDGSEGGTALLLDLPDTHTVIGSHANQAVGGNLFFTVSEYHPDFIPRASLWATDGTAAGTTLLVDIVEGWGFSDMTDVEGTLFLIRQSYPGFDYELWKSDGTKAGTMRVKEFHFDVYGDARFNRRPADLVAASGRLFFTYDDGLHGRELWTSDGISTILVADVNPGEADSVDANAYYSPFAVGLTNLGGSLYYAGDDGQTGFEPWVLDTTDLFTTIQIDAGLERGSVNVAANGAIAVSVLTTAEFDAAHVDVATVDFAGASAFQSDLLDLDGDGDLDLLLHFRVEDTMLRGIYEQLLADDLDADGVLDSRNQLAEVALAGLTLDEQLFEGHDSLSLSLSGRALRELLDELFAGGV
jgi:ELWxxDGT repeat protein